MGWSIPPSSASGTTRRVCVTVLHPPFGGTHKCPPTGGLMGSMEGRTYVSALASWEDMWVRA